MNSYFGFKSSSVHWVFLEIVIVIYNETTSQKAGILDTEMLARTQ